MMEKKRLKQQLYEIIEQTDSEEILEAVYTILSSQPPVIDLMQEQKEELDKRVQRHLSGESTSSSWEQVQQCIRSSKYRFHKILFIIF